MEVDLNDNKRFQSLNALENRLLLLAEAGCVITLTPNQSAEYPYRLNLKGPNAHMSVASAKVYDSIETLYYSYLQCTGLNTLIKEQKTEPYPKEGQCFVCNKTLVECETTAKEAGFDQCEWLASK